MALREGQWLCPHCGSENMGRFESCQSCAAARPKDVRFYLPGDAQALEDARLIRDALSGVDWYCSHCGGANPNAVEGQAVTSCHHCGQARDGEDVSGQVVHHGPGEVPRSAAEASPPRPSRRATESDLQGRAEARGSRWRLPVAVALFLLLALTWWLWPRDYEGQVTALSWQRSIAIERMATHVESGWDLPAGGRLQASETRLRSWRDVIDRYVSKNRQVSVHVPSGTETYSCGTTNLGNGYFQDRTCTRQTYRTEWRTETYQEPVYRKEPVYDDWMTWEIDRWSVVRVFEAKGRATPPTWPEVESLSPREREGRHGETYTAKVSREGESIDLTLSLQDWSSLSEGESVTWRDSPLGDPVLLPDG